MAFGLGSSRVILTLVYLIVRSVLGLLATQFPRDLSKDAELLVLRHENAVLRRHIARVRYEPAARVWLAALARLVRCGTASCDRKNVRTRVEFGPCRSTHW